jgi:hypothetical protein
LVGWLVGWLFGCLVGSRQWLQSTRERCNTPMHDKTKPRNPKCSLLHFHPFHNHHILSFNTAVFYDVTPRVQIEVYRRLGGTCYPHIYRRIL